MFSDSDVEMTGFTSCPETVRLVNDGCSQTVNSETHNQETQTGIKHSTGMQAVPEEVSNFVDYPIPYDVSKLLKFLKRIAPHVEEELKNCDSTNDSLNFEQYEKSNFNSDIEDGFERSTQLPKQVLIQLDYCKEKVISNLTWNSTGVLLAVSYAEKNHEGWCSHETSVGIYNTGKSKFEKNPPTSLLKVSSCVKCIQFHPYVPSLLAGGFHSGDIIIWDLTSDEEVPLTKVKGNSGNEAHADALTSLTWREDRNGMWLVTTGRDGKIIFWKVTVSNLTYEAHERFLILKQHLTSMVNTSKEYLEVLHISFWAQREFDFVIAVAGGAIFHCSLRTDKYLTSDPIYKDPVSMSYESHQGIVTRVSCTAKSDIFASCGTDSEIHIYKSEVAAPLHVIHTGYPMIGVEWTKTPKCLVSWGCSPKIELHKVNVEEGSHVSTDAWEVASEISTLALNSVRQGKMAAGNTTGQVFVISDVAF